MANTGKYGKRELGNVKGQIAAVETVQVGLCTSSADESHRIETGFVVKDGLQRSYNRRFGTNTLHNRGEESGIKVNPEWIVVQMIHEVAVAGSRIRRNNRHPLCGKGQFEFAVHIQHTGLFERLKGCPSLKGQLAYRVGGVHIPYIQ